MVRNRAFSVITVAIIAGASFGVPAFASVYFTPGGSFVIGDRPDCLAVGDVTGDGSADLVAANVGHYSQADGRFVERAISVFAGDGTGGFSEFETVDVVDVPEAVIIADVNRDDVNEIILATADEGVTIFVRSGSTFSPLGPFPCGTLPISMAATDVNGDDAVDIVTANNGSDTVSVLPGNGDGTFGTAENYKCGAGPVDICVVDLDGDGFPDVAVANNLGGTVSVFLNGPGSALTDMGDIEAGNAPQALVAGHFGGSSDCDLAVGDFVDDNVTLLIGDGDGTFTWGGSFSVGHGVNDLWAADLNQDGLDELLVAANDNSLRVYQKTNQQYVLGESHSTGVTPISIVAANLNGDVWQPDAAVAAYADGMVTLFWRNEADLLGDVNGDGDINAVDVQLVINEALGIATLYDCDISGDDEVDAVDIQLVVNGALSIG